MVTLAPREIPMSSMTIMPMTGILLPTAAIALFPTKRPNKKTSALLNSCSNRPMRTDWHGKQEEFVGNRSVQHVDAAALILSFMLHIYTLFLIMFSFDSE